MQHGIHNTPRYTPSTTLHSLHHGTFGAFIPPRYNPCTTVHSAHSVQHGSLGSPITLTRPVLQVVTLLRVTYYDCCVCWFMRSILLYDTVFFLFYHTLSVQYVKIWKTKTIFFSVKIYPQFHSQTHILTSASHTRPHHRMDIFRM